MKSRWTISLLALLSVFLNAALFADEPVFEFVEGLRNRGYFDTADEYLDQVEKDPRISPEVKKQIPYERAVTLRRGVRAVKSAKLQHQQLDRAAAYLEQFIKANPNHPLAGKAKTDRGRIFFTKAEVNVIELQGPANAERKAEIKKQGLEYIAKARAEFRSAHDDYEKVWKSFPVFIPETEVEKRKARRQAEANLAFAKIDLAKTDYLEAHLHPRKSKEFRDLLTAAFKKFDAIHTSYRSMGYGLYARMWQGKCFEEQGEIGRALGIYNELLAHEGDSGIMRTIQRDAMHFRMICLNHESKNDHLLVDQEGEQWIKQNRRYLTTQTGLGVRYEMARARFALGTTSDKVPPKEKPKYLALALADASFAARFPGKYKMQAALLVDKIKRARGDEIADPTNFEDGYTAAMVVYSNIKPHLDAIRKAQAEGKPSAEIEKLKKAFRTDLEEAMRLHKLTQSFFKPGDDASKLNKSRFTSAYLAYLMVQHFGQNDLVYDGAVLADFSARHAQEENPDQAMDAAYLAMALYIRAYNLAPEGQRDAEMRWIIDTGKYLVSHWPRTKRAAEASLNIGKLYDKREQSLAAARWYARVPASAKDHFAQSQIYAGLAYWNQFVSAASLKPEREILLNVFRSKIGEDLSEGVANLLNPSWRKWQHLQRERDNLIAELKQQNAPSKKTSSQKKPASPKGKGKKQPNRAKKKKSQAASKPRPSSKPVVNPATHPEVVKLNQQIAALKSKSLAELKAAFTELTKRAPGDLTEQKLRMAVVAELGKLSENVLRAKQDQLLAKLDDKSLKETFNDELTDWRELAAQYLRVGIAQLESQIPEQNASSDDVADLAIAKATLAEYLNAQGDYSKVLQLLTQKPHAVMDVISVPDESKRPKDGIRGREFAGQVYQLLLRAYVGTQNIDDALKSMTALETIASADEDNNITLIYEQLGRQLQKEIQRLRNRGDDARLKNVRDSFKRFLGELFNRKTALNYSTLIWIAETYYGLGQGLGDDPDAASYFEKAYSAYKQILDSADLDEDRTIGVQLRQINCKRRQGEFPEAFKIVQEVVKKRPLLLRAQIQAAYTLQQWGASGELEKHMEAINGIPKQNIWGWVGISRKLRGLLDSSNAEISPEDRTDYEQRYIQARYNIAWNRLHYGIGQSPEKTSKKRKAVLDFAMAELLDFASGIGVVDDKKFPDIQTGELIPVKSTFDELFLKIQEEMGKSSDQITQIEWAKPQQVVQPVPTIAIAKTDSKQSNAPQKVDQQKKKKKESSTLGMIFGILFLIAALAGGGWFLYKSSQQEKSRRRLYATAGVGAVTPKKQTSASPKRSATRPAGAKKPATANQAKPKPGAKSPPATQKRSAASGRKQSPPKQQKPSVEKKRQSPPSG
ncbi:MAG: hypothetical protein Tsb009_03380 [Planctomycetaceae bacterium]